MSNGTPHLALPGAVLVPRTRLERACYWRGQLDQLDQLTHSIEIAFGQGDLLVGKFREARETLGGAVPTDLVELVQPQRQRSGFERMMRRG